MPTLRLYAWQGPWLSLGYGQRLGAERLAACAEAGVGVVRRATGGLAVLHGADLTYAVAAPESAAPRRPPTHLRDPGGGAPGRAARPGGRRPAQRGGVGRRRPGWLRLLRASRRPTSSASAGASSWAAPSGAAGAGCCSTARSGWRRTPARPAAPPGWAGRGLPACRSSGAASLPSACTRCSIEAFAAALDARLERGVLAPAEAALAARRGADPLRAVSRFAPGVFSRPPLDDR